MAQEAEGKAKEAAEALSVAVEERDSMQASASAAAEQLTESMKHVQEALGVLGIEQPSDETVQELEDTKIALANASAELETLRAEAETAAQTIQELKATQDALAIMTSERDQLQAAAESAANQALELQNLQDALAAMTAERDALAVAKTAVSILDGSESVVAEYENISDLKLSGLSLQPGEYIIRILIVNAVGEEIGHYDLPYTVPAAE